jgi:hypothetical protein
MVGLIVPASSSSSFRRASAALRNLPRHRDEAARRPAGDCRAEVTAYIFGCMHGPSDVPPQPIARAERQKSSVFADGDAVTRPCSGAHERGRTVTPATDAAAARRRRRHARRAANSFVIIASADLVMQS